jgi:hypothetical protein
MCRVQLVLLAANFIDFVGVDDATQHACEGGRVCFRHAAELVGTSDA